jgi:hypothetical protein
MMVTFMLTLLAALTSYEVILPGSLTTYSAIYAQCGMRTSMSRHFSRSHFMLEDIS